MSEKSRDGVVNKYGQTHDVKNLFVSDGSQFTTSAACNPTLTIVALAFAGRLYRGRDAERRDLICTGPASWIKVNWIKVQFQHLPRDLAGDLSHHPLASRGKTCRED